MGFGKIGGQWVAQRFGGSRYLMADGFENNSRYGARLVSCCCLVGTAVSQGEWTMGIESGTGSYSAARTRLRRSLSFCPDSERNSSGVINCMARRSRR
jgi:hypothetical protein